MCPRDFSPDTLLRESVLMGSFARREVIFFFFLGARARQALCIRLDAIRIVSDAITADTAAFSFGMEIPTWGRN